MTPSTRRPSRRRSRSDAATRTGGPYIKRLLTAAAHRAHASIGLIVLCAAWSACPATAAAAGADTFALPGTPTALQTSWESFDDEPAWLTPIWAASSAGVTRLAPRLDGSMAAHFWAFPDAEDPAAALDTGPNKVAVLDRSSASLEVFSAPLGRRTLRRMGRTRVGQDPMAITDIDPAAEDDPDGYAVADRGSADVSLLRPANASGTRFALTRVAVGAQPDAIAAGRIDADDRADLAVANAASNSVSLLFGDGQSKMPTRVDVPLTAAPTALAVTSPASRRLLAGTPAVVATTADGSVWLIDGGRHPQARRVISGLGDPIAVAALALNYDRYLDLAVLDRASGILDVLYGTAPGRFAAPVAAWRGGDPVALTTGVYGGDSLDDLAVADAATARATVVLTPGDHQIAPGERTQELSSYQGSLAARDGWLAWTRAITARRNELVVRSPHGTVSRLPYRSRQPFAPYLGEDLTGRPVVTFLLCRPGCRAYAYELGRRHARVLRWRAPSGCTLGAAAVWRTASAVEYDAGASGHCTRKGVWVSDGRLRSHRIGKSAFLEDLDGRQVIWLAVTPRSTSVRLSSISGEPARTLYTRPTTEGLNVGSLQLDGRDALWSNLIHTVVAFRQRGRTRQCWFGAIPSSWLPGGDASVPALPSLDFAVDHGRVFYANQFGVFAVAPARVGWTASCPR